MRNNAILIASILFVAGCATNRAYQTSGSSNDYQDPSVAAQYDPASGSAGTIVTGTGQSYETSRNPNLSVNDFHADSSIRGGSNEARGYRGRGLPTEGPAHPIDPAVQADSSIRGGSPMARQRERSERFEPSTVPDGRIKADSSIRGGSNEARYPNRRFGGTYQSSGDGNSGIAVIGENSSGFDNQRDDFGEGRSDNWLSDKGNGSLRGSANWNPSDDLMKDGTESRQTDSDLKADASVGGSASSEIGSGSSESRDALTSPGARKDLNSSRNLEKDISGQYQVDSTGSNVAGSNAAELSGTSSELNSDRSSTSVGGPGSTETGVKSSSDLGTTGSTSDTTDPVNSQDSHSLFQNNRAQGVGSAAAGESVVPSSRVSNNSGADSQLAQRVKGTLTRESTGTHGMMRHDVARNIQVTSEGGTVTLKGTVPSQKDKEMIEIRAREISGVQRVDNQLTVSAQSDPSVRDLSGRNLEDVTDQLHDLDQPQQ